MKAYVILYELDEQDKKMDFNSSAYPHDEVIGEAISYLNVKMEEQGIDSSRYRFVNVV